MKIAILLSYANPHVLGWLQKMDFVNHEIVIGSIKSIKSYRKGYFEREDHHSNIQYFFRNRSSKKEFRNFIKSADVFISLGIFEKEFLKSLVFLNPKAKVFILSEPFLGISDRRKNLFRISWSNLVRLLHPNIDFLAIGGKIVKEHYMKLGFKNSKYYNFGHFPVFKETEIKNIKEVEGTNFLFVGQLVERKGIDKLIYALNYLRDEYGNANWSFKIVGDGPKRKEINEYLSNVKDRRIDYLGLIKDPEQLEKIYECSNILFMPSVFDGWGAVINEAVSKKMIVLASKTAFAGEFLIQNKKNGFRFRYDSNEEIRNSLDWVFINSENFLNYRRFSDKIFSEWNPQNAANSVHRFLQKETNENYSLLNEI